jgi:malate synthase
VHHPEGVLEDGRTIDMEMIRRIIGEEMAAIQEKVGQTQFSQIKYHSAAKLFEAIIANTEFEEFLTLKAYEHLD